MEVFKLNLKSAMASRFIEAETGILIISIVVSLYENIIYGAGVFILLSLVANIGSYLSYKSREYRFSENQLEFYEGFISIEQRNIAYDRITDVSLKKPFLQRIFDTGTVKINTAGSDSHEIKMSFLNDPEAKYNRIREITRT